MAAEPIYASRRKVAASYLTAVQQGNEQNTGTYDALDSLSVSVIEPLYKLKEDGTLTGEISLLQVCLARVVISSLQIQEVIIQMFSFCILIIVDSMECKINRCLSV